MKTTLQLKSYLLLLGIIFIFSSCEEKDMNPNILKKDFLIVSQHQTDIKSAGIFALDKQNLEYVNPSQSTRLIPKDEKNTIFYSENNNKSLTVFGYSPYIKHVENYTIPINIEDQTFDLIVLDDVDVFKTTSLVFKHQLAKVTFNVSLPSNINKNNISLTIPDLWKEANYNLIEKRLVDFTAKSDMEMSLADFSNNKKSVLLIPEFTDNRFVINFVYDSHILPVTIPKDKLPKKELETIYDIKIDNYLLATLEKVSMVDRITNSLDGNLNLEELSINVSSGNLKISEFVLLNKTTNRETHYTYKENKWVGYPEPVYINTIEKGTCFYAKYTGKQDVVSHNNDIVEAESVLNGSVLNLDFKHVNSKLSFHLSKSQNTPSSVDINQSNIKLWNSLIYSYDNVNIFLTPQTVHKNDSMVVITNTGLHYKYIFDKDIVLTENSNFYLDLKLESEIKPSANSFSVTISPWEENYAQNDVSNLILKTISVDFPGDGVLVIEDTTNRKYEYDYVKNTNAFTPKPPCFYWENYPTQNTYTFKGVFTMKEDTGNPEKDILESNNLTVNWGEDLNFNAFKHINTKLEIKLEQGAGYTSAEWENLLKMRKIRFSPSLVASPDFETTNIESIILKPRQITSDDILKLIVGSYTYTLNLRAVFISGRYLSSLDANKCYILTVTVNKTYNLGMVCEVASWDVEYGNGSFIY